MNQVKQKGLSLCLLYVLQQPPPRKRRVAQALWGTEPCVSREFHGGMYVEQSMFRDIISHSSPGKRWQLGQSGGEGKQMGLLHVGRRANHFGDGSLSDQQVAYLCAQKSNH